jgi:Spy/CpxP family protein refolding chaperone
MNTTGSPSTQQTAPTRRWRRIFVGSALIASGIIIGVGTSALSQGYGRWSDDGPGRQERFDGPRSRDDGDGRVFFRDRDGPRGWFGRDRDGRGWGGDPGWHGHRFGGLGGPGLTPGRIERIVNRIGWAVDASTEQKQKLTDIMQRAANDLAPLREKHLDGRRQIREVLAAATIDRGKLESLRADQMKLADAASQRITTAFADAADVLTPAQRADLARRLERFGGRRG